MSDVGLFASVGWYLTFYGVILVEHCGLYLNLFHEKKLRKDNLMNNNKTVHSHK